MKLDTLFQEIRQIHNRLDDIDQRLSNWKPTPIMVPDSKLLSLPDHLRRTYLVVASKGECSAAQVSTSTGISRADESLYLNHLVRMGWLRKHREGRTVVFNLILKEELTQ
jgi:uncharacterized membrane protein